MTKEQVIDTLHLMNDIEKRSVDYLLGWTDCHFGVDGLDKLNDKQTEELQEMLEKQIYMEAKQDEIPPAVREAFPEAKVEKGKDHFAEIRRRYRFLQK